MKTICEVAKNADKLYADFLNDNKELIPNKKTPITEEEQQEILEWMYEHDYMDTDEYDMPEDCEYYSNHTGHWDEMSFMNYLYATDEDGEWINPYDTDF